MPRSLAARLTALTVGLVLALLFIAFNGWFLSRAMSNVALQHRWIEHTYRVINQIETVISSLKDAETGNRGYILAPNDISLKLRDFGIKSVQPEVERLRGLTTDNPWQQQNIERLRGLIDARLASMDRTFNAFRRSHRITGYANKAFAEGQLQMSEIRTLTQSMEENESRLLREREAEMNRQNNFALWTLIATTVANLCLIWAFWFFFRRHMISQDRQARAKAREAWIKADTAEATTIVGGDMTLSTMADKVVSFLVEKAKYPAVNIYLEKNGELRLESGTVPKDVLANLGSYRVGEDLVGRAARGRDLFFVEDVPENFFEIRSSLGAAKPKVLIYAPVRFRGELVAVIEIGAFQKLDKDRADWLKSVIEGLGAALTAARSRERLRDLLEETQRQSEELQLQQEELRTSNEELGEQTKALIESQNRLQVQTEELRQANEELESQTMTLESQQESLDLKNQALETSRRKLEEKATELERTSTYKSDFLAKMSHELRTPLNSLMILASILRENKEGNLSSQQAEFAKTIYEAGSDLIELINDILDLSKLEAHKLNAHPEAFGLRAMLEQLNSTFKTQAEAKGLKLIIDCDPKLPDRLFTDRQRLQQILRNLVSNALKFTERGEIAVLITPASFKDGIRFEVQDSGIGIPEAKKRLIWEAFEQADGSVSRKYGGTGLGLSISRELALLLGGQIDLQSEEGVGSRFALEIPMDLEATSRASGLVVAPSTAPSVSPPSQEEAPAGASVDMDEYGEDSKTILVIEADDRFREAVADAARAHGFFPIEVRSGKEALEILRRHKPIAILLDSQAPEAGEQSWLTRIRALPGLKNVPIHMISAIEDQNDVFRSGAIGSLVKPVSIGGVQAALSRIENLIEKKMKRLLIIEDDPAQRLAITELVGTADTEIIAVDSGKKALAILREGGIDCIVLDLSLPDVSGFDLLDNIAKETDLSLPPIIVYTGQDLSKDEEDRLRRYSDSIILKGAKSPERLLDEVNLFLHRVERRESEVRNTSAEISAIPDDLFKGRSVLLVDDDVRNLFALTNALEGKGFRVTIARNGIEALEKLKAHPETDVVLMDIMMPKMDGFEATRRIRESTDYKDLPIIALTAKTMKGEHERCIQAGANDYLPKPIHLPNLLSALKVWVSQSLTKTSSRFASNPPANGAL